MPLWNFKDDRDWNAFQNCIKQKFDPTKIQEI